MKGHQLLRGFGILGVVSVYVARLIVIGNGAIELLGYSMDPIALAVIGVLVLAAPETIEQLPFGPTKRKNGSD